MDRTPEFLQAARLACILPGVSRAKSGVAVEVSPFSAGVTLIERGLHVVSVRLIALGVQSTACSSPFRTPSDARALQHSTGAIKSDIIRLSGLVAGLRCPDVSDTAARHSQSVVEILRSRVLALNKDLESRLSDHWSRLHETVQREQTFTFAPHQHVQGVSDIMSDTSEQQQMSQQPRDRTHSEAALQHVQRTLLETGALVQHLSVLVAEQGQVAIRIDDNVMETSLNVERATQHVTSYFHRQVTAATGTRLLMQALGVVGFTLLIVIALA